MSRENGDGAKGREERTGVRDINARGDEEGRVKINVLSSYLYSNISSRRNRFR
jgi:hypothetical protein